MCDVFKGVNVCDDVSVCVCDVFKGVNVCV